MGQLFQPLAGNPGQLSMNDRLKRARLRWKAWCSRQRLEGPKSHLSVSASRCSMGRSSRSCVGGAGGGGGACPTK
eukprot:11670561-Alexandrium_andersonii.AAC.1